MTSEVLDKVLTIMGPAYKFWPEHSKDEMLVFTHVSDDESGVAVNLAGINALDTKVRENTILGRCNAAKSILFNSKLH